MERQGARAVIVLKNANVVDVDAEMVMESDIVIQGDRILEVSGDSALAQNHEHARVIDLGGRYVIPGLIDSHVHVTSVIADSASIARLSPYYVAAGASKVLAGMIARGFTTVRDVGGADWGLARAVDEGLFEGPRIYFGGPAFSQTGGHGDMRGVGDPAPLGARDVTRIDAVVDGVEPLRRAVREELRKGAHHVKIFLSGGVAASPTDQYDAPQYSLDEIRVAVEEAAASKKYVTAHAYTSAAVERGLDCGVRSFEHGNLLDSEGADALVAAGAFLVPTLVTYDAMAREGESHGLPSNGRWQFADVLRWARTALECADRAGVDIAFGTDLLGSMHVYQSDEFLLRAEIQSAQRVLAGATTIPARLLGAEDSLGRIAPGYLADLLVVERNPLEDARVLAHPEAEFRMIMQRGAIKRLDDLN